MPGSCAAIDADPRWRPVDRGSAHQPIKLEIATGQAAIESRDLLFVARTGENNFVVASFLHKTRQARYLLDCRGEDHYPITKRLVDPDEYGRIAISALGQEMNRHVGDHLGHLAQQLRC